MDVFAPANEADAAAIVSDCSARGLSLSIEGNGSKRGLGRPIETAGLLKLNRLSGIVAYEPEELVITVRAGTPLADVEAALAEKSQCLAFEPASWSFDRDARPTIGGTVAAGASGSRRVALGGARDHTIGFRAINGLGESFKAGGKVVKNVTGYDLPKLAAGSFGTLFAMTELTLRTYPRTLSPTSLVIRDLDLESGCALMRRIVGSPWEVTGAAYLPRVALARLETALADAHSLTVIRFEGSAESMSARSQECAQALAQNGEIVGDERSAQFWRQLQQLKAFEPSRVLWRLSVPPASAVGVVAALRPECFVADWAGGLLWIEPSAAAANDVHDVARSFGGHATLFRGDKQIRRNVFQPLDHATLALTRRLKAAFDPRGIFNPGRMHEGI